MEPETTMQIEPLFFMLLVACVAIFMVIMGLVAGYAHGKQRGRSKEIEDRMCRDIIHHVRETGTIPPYYSEKDIKLAQRYGKKRDFFFTIGDPQPFRVIRGGKQ